MWIKTTLYWLLICVCIQASAALYNLRGVAIIIDGEDALQSQQQQVANVASHQLGRPYRLGGDTPEQGFDCSGLVHYVYQHSVKKSLPRTSRALGKMGVSVKQAALQAGDLVFFNTTGQPYSHVGIYLSEQRFIHAPQTGKHVTIANLKHDYWQKRYLGAKRILKP